MARRIPIAQANLEMQARQNKNAAIGNVLNIIPKALQGYNQNVEKEKMRTVGREILQNNITDAQGLSELATRHGLSVQQMAPIVSAVKEFAQLANVNLGQQRTKQQIRAADQQYKAGEQLSEQRTFELDTKRQAKSEYDTSRSKRTEYMTQLQNAQTPEEMKQIRQQAALDPELSQSDFKRIQKDLSDKKYGWVKTADGTQQIYSELIPGQTKQPVTTKAKDKSADKPMTVPQMMNAEKDIFKRALDMMMSSRGIRLDSVSGMFLDAAGQQVDPTTIFQLQQGAVAVTTGALEKIRGPQKMSPYNAIAQTLSELASEVAQQGAAQGLAQQHQQQHMTTGSGGLPQNPMQVQPQTGPRRPIAPAPAPRQQGRPMTKNFFNNLLQQTSGGRRSVGRNAAG
jgi:hypothetical protein